MSGGKGPDWHSVLYNWLIPNRNAYDDISSDSVWVRGVSVKGAKGLECGRNGGVIFDEFDRLCIVCSFSGSGGGGCWLGCTGADCSSGILVSFGLIPSIVQESIMIAILCVRSRGRKGCGWSRVVGVLFLWEEELIVFSFGLIRILRDRTSSGASGEDGIYLSLRGLYGHGSVINIVTGDDVVILVDFERVAIHINY